MTKREAAIIGAYTGYLLGDFTDMHAYIEEKLKRPIFTHELASDQVEKEIKEKTKEDFTNIEIL